MAELASMCDEIHVIGGSMGGVLALNLAATYIYVIYQAILLEETILDIFKLYLSLDNLYTIFATESFLLIFCLNFLALNLFL